VSVDLLFPDDPGPVRALRLGSLCTGYGGLDLGVRAVLGGELAFTADPDRHIRAILAARFPGVPNLGDITAVDFTTLATHRPVDVLTAGFPCQDISTNGRRAGIQKGNRSGLWFDVARAVRALQPRLLVVENVAAIRYPDRGLDRVLCELAQAGYDTWWRCLHAADVGAPHYRERLFLLAQPHTKPITNTDLRGVEPCRPSAQQGCIAADPVGGRHPGQCDARRTTSPWTATTTVRRHHPHPRHSGGGDTPPRLDDGRPEAGLTCPTGAHPGGNDAINPSTNPSTDGPTDSSTDDRVDDAVDDAGHEAVDGRGDFDILAEAVRIEWGIYRPAIQRWARVLGRPAPPPSTPDPPGRVRLSPRFVEWLMGLPAGWVTDVPSLPWGAQIRALGNGVVPLQAATALRLLLRDAGLCIARISSITSAASIPDTASITDAGSPEKTAPGWAA
jgi:DNA (cytosine-5)-methyltransferase 1